MNYLKNFIIILVYVFVLLIGTGCTSYTSKLFEGKIVDEKGSPIQNVTVKLCYPGWKWDWSMAGGFPLTMGHPFCSESVVTDKFGNYKVIFSAPDSTTIIARKKDWIQTQSFLAKDGRVVLVRMEEYLHREKEKANKQETRDIQRRGNESNVDYYCRVIRKRSSQIELIYQGNRVKIVQTLLIDSGKLVFSVAGPYDSVQALANDVTISESIGDAKTSIINNFIALPSTSVCGESMFFVQSADHVHSSLLDKMSSVYVEISSHHVGFTMKIWNREVANRHINTDSPPRR